MSRTRKTPSIRLVGNFAFVLAIVGVITGCTAVDVPRVDDDGQGQVTPTPTPLPTPPPQDNQDDQDDQDDQNVTGQSRLFIANFDGNSVTSYADPQFVNGNIAPDTNLQGAQTNLFRPSDLLVNPAADLIVSNFGQPARITSYNNASQTNGNLAPDGNIEGAATLLVQPIAMAYNASQDLLFVLDTNTEQVYVYANTTASTFNGNLAPIRTFGTFTTGDILNPTDMSLAANDDLYISNNGGEVLVFANASSLNGDVAPTRIIESTSFALLWDVVVTDDDTMFVVQQTFAPANLKAGFVFTFNNASTLNGFVEPDFALEVPGAEWIRGLAVDAAGTGYVVDYFEQAIYSYDGIATLNGTLPPDRTIQGADTLLDGPIEVFIDE